MIKVHELDFQYPGSSESTLHQLNFEVAEQEIFGFLGPSGAGKSTTQNILIGLLKSYRGSANVLGRELTDWNDDFYEQVGVCFELPNHYLKLTARENLNYFRSLYRPPNLEPEKVLQWVGLSDDADKRVSDFSKGMKIRLNLARSMIHQPRILFLDEPTGGLDPVNARRIKDLILTLRRNGTTVFVTTHDMLVADQLCDRVAFISGGRINQIGNPEDLKIKHGRRSVQIDYIDGAQCYHKREFPLDDIGRNIDFLEILQSNSRVEKIHSQESTLEQVFVDLTGQELTP